MERIVVKHLAVGFEQSTNDQEPLLRLWQGEDDNTLKTTPRCPIEQIGMVGGRDEQCVCWPPLELKQEHVDDALQLTNVAGIVTSLP